MPDKNTTQPMQQPAQPTIKHHFITAALTAGILLVIGLFIWIPFKLIPALFSSGSNFVATTLTSTLVEGSSTNQTQNTSSATAAPQSGNTNTATQNTTHTYAPSYNYYGLPDLAISYEATGIIDPATHQFVQTSYAGANDLVAVKFRVANIGTNVTGPWMLRMNMPSRTTPYDDVTEQSIRPGDAIDFVASFDTPTAQGVNTAYITADPLNVISELSEGNNQIAVPINIAGTTYSYNNNYNYGTGNYTANPYGTLYTWTNITANCYANPQTIYPGSTVTWTATASGGNGYFTYAWSGSDGLSDSGQIVNKTYYTTGAKTAVLIVTSNGVSVSKVCNAYVY